MVKRGDFNFYGAKVKVIKLKNRGAIEISGDNALVFLNNLISNDVEKSLANSPIYSALLTPQGKYLFDLFVYSLSNSNFLIDTNAPLELEQKLGIYKMRSNVEIKLRDDLAVFADLGTSNNNNYTSFTDPRHSEMGLRIFAPATTPETQDFAAYESHRLKLGIPDLSQDLIREKDFALEGLMDELNGIDFQKGCYVGQEMTSRMKRRGTLKQKLCRIKTTAQIPFDTPIMANDSEIGRIRSNNGEYGIALVRFDRWQTAAQNGEKLLANDSEIIIDPPKWLLI